MTNAELIAALRWCKEHEACDKDASAECPYWHHWIDGEDCAGMLSADAADALEAADKRIAELEKQAEHTDEVHSTIFAVYSKQAARIAELSLDCEMYQQKCMELEAQKPKEGEWFKYNNPNYSPFDDSGEYLYQCNKCGKVVVKATNYCPNCGAKMKGEKNE